MSAVDFAPVDLYESHPYKFGKRTEKYFRRLTPLPELEQTLLKQ